MGAGAVKGSELPEHYTRPVSSRQYHRPHSTSSSDSVMATCEACSNNFTLFRRKKICISCGRQFCSSCVLKNRENGKKMSRSRCKKCIILESGRFTENDLTQWKIRDLRMFLMTQDIPTNNCREKHDLIELLMEHFGRSNRNGDSQHDIYIEELTERMRQENLQNINVAQSSNDQISPTVETPEDNVPSYAAEVLPLPISSSDNQSVPEIVAQIPSPIPVPERTPENNEENTQSVQGQSSTPPSVEPATQRTTLNPETQHSHPSHRSTNSSPVPKKRMTINQVGSSEQIDMIGVRGLKEILSSSYVDYRGCCEKTELQSKVHRLYQENLINKQKADEYRNVLSSGQGTINSTDCEESDMCKICMDAVIDCVLLECGHMVSCTPCGKQLAECPICRQYVTRAVHVFRT